MVDRVGLLSQKTNVCSNFMMFLTPEGFFKDPF